MEVGGVRPSSFHGSPGSACKAQLSGSLLAAVLARSWGQSALQAGPAPSSLFLFPGPSSKLWAGWGTVGAILSEWGCVCVLTCTRTQGRSRPPGLTPLTSISTLSQRCRR